MFSDRAPGREAHGVVLARAVSELAVLVELAAPMLGEDGVLLASKTRRALREERVAADAAAERCGLAFEAPVPLAASPLLWALTPVRKAENPPLRNRSCLTQTLQFTGPQCVDRTPD